MSKKPPSPHYKTKFWTPSTTKSQCSPINRDFCKSRSWKNNWKKWSTNIRDQLPLLRKSRKGRLSWKRKMGSSRIGWVKWWGSGRLSMDVKKYSWMKLPKSLGLWCDVIPIIKNGSIRTDLCCIFFIIPIHFLKIKLAKIIKVRSKSFQIKQCFPTDGNHPNHADWVTWKSFWGIAVLHTIDIRNRREKWQGVQRRWGKVRIGLFSCR